MGVDIRISHLIVFGLFAGLMYRFELFAMFNSSCYSYLNQIHEKEIVETLVNNMIVAPPSIKWEIQCYHTITVDGGSNPHTGERFNTRYIDT